MFRATIYYKDCTFSACFDTKEGVFDWIDFFADDDSEEIVEIVLDKSNRK